MLLGVSNARSVPNVYGSVITAHCSIGPNLPVVRCDGAAVEMPGVCIHYCAAHLVGE